MGWLWRQPREQRPEPVSVCGSNLVEKVRHTEERVAPWGRMVFPTEQDLLAEDALFKAFQPTASGKPESALFGSTRTTVASNGGVMSAFHEGIDIAALRRDKRRHPLDKVVAITDGTVVYVNKVAGNSNYGKYVVVGHSDPLGKIYSLYAHLAEIAAGIEPGKIVQAGDWLGTMGNTSSSGIPLERSHLHLEVALLANEHFDRWFKSQNMKPDHGLFNGQNLIAIDPISCYRFFRDDPTATFGAFLKTIPPAFVVAVRAKPFDFFGRYAGLWEAGSSAGDVLVMACTANGLPLSGRWATEEESALLEGRPWRVLKVDEQVLGANGCHLVSRSSGQWTLTSKGQRWLEILAYPEGVFDRPVVSGSALDRKPVRRRKR